MATPPPPSITPVADPAAETLVAARAVTHRFGDDPVLADVDLVLDRDSFTGIVGPSGAGKTTLLRVLLGSLAPSSGRVDRRAGLRIGYVPQVEAVDWSFPVTVGEVALMGRAPEHPWPWTGRSERLAVAGMLDRLGLAGLERRHIRDLSGGQQQRVFVARALLQGAGLLVLDEPTAGVDVATRHDLLHLLADLHHDRGVAIVLTTHDLNGLAAHLPHLVCLNRSVVASGAPIDVLTPPVLEATFGAPMEVLVHSGLPVVVDVHHHVHPAPARTEQAPHGHPPPGSPKGSRRAAG